MIFFPNTALLIPPIAIGVIRLCVSSSCDEMPCLVKKSLPANGELIIRQPLILDKTITNLQLPYPNIPIAHRVAMILQHQRQLFCMCLVFWQSPIYTRTHNFYMILNQYPIVQNRNVSRLFNGPVIMENRSLENNIESLPFAWRPACINQGNMLLVNAPDLSIWVCYVLVRI